ncbi:hypothetical protein [Corticibacter populi]|nr:hypothetical protein [Corticibacter populi]
MAAQPDQPDQPWYEALFRQCARLMLTLRQLPVPRIAKVQGIATAALVASVRCGDACQVSAACPPST